MTIIEYIFKRLKCIWKGHSYPFLNCFHCGSRSPWEFYRDSNDELIRDENGNPQ